MNDPTFESALERFFDGRAHARIGPARYGLANLTAVERATIERAVSSRQREYASARVMARDLLERLGCGRPTVATGPDRAPIWPEGVAGSIAHADGMCFVVVTTDPEIVSVGVDLEPVGPLEPELWPEICTAGELDWLGRQPAQDRGRWAKVVFCAKEAFYKCQYAVTRLRLTFSDVTTTIDVASHTFEARLATTAEPLAAGFGLKGTYAEVEGWLLAAVICTRSDLDGVRVDGSPSTKRRP